MNKEILLKIKEAVAKSKETKSNINQEQISLAYYKLWDYILNEYMNDSKKKKHSVDYLCLLKNKKIYTFIINTNDEHSSFSFNISKDKLYSLLKEDKFEINETDFIDNGLGVYTIRGYISTSKAKIENFAKIDEKPKQKIK